MLRHKARLHLPRMPELETGTVRQDKRETEMPVMGPCLREIPKGAEHCMNQPLSVTVTCHELLELASCACRMTTYAEPDSPCVISALRAGDGTPIYLTLDRECIRKDGRENGLSRTCGETALQIISHGANLMNSEVPYCLDLEKHQKLRK